MQADRDARVRERAYRIWEGEGRPDGRAEEHWHLAEREIADEEAREDGLGRDPGAASASDAAAADAPLPRRSARVRVASTAGNRPAAKPRS
jgi:hypothetical protein